MNPLVMAKKQPLCKSNIDLLCFAAVLFDIALAKLMYSAITVNGERTKNRERANGL